jgi:hypothetical protein
LPEIFKALDREVKVKLIVSYRYISLASVFPKQKDESFDKLKRGMEIRLVHKILLLFLGD